MPVPAPNPVAAADVVVRWRPGGLVITPSEQTQTWALAAVLVALDRSAFDAPVVLDLSRLLLTATALDAIHGVLCRPRGFSCTVVMVAASAGDRRRLRRCVTCRETPMYASVDDVLPERRAGDSPPR